MTKTADLTAPLLPTTPTNGTVPLDRDPRDPFTSLTNSTFATSRLPPSRASRSSLRQTSLFDAFPRPPSPASSSSPSSLPFDNNADASTSALSSPCATCPCAVNLGDGDRESGNVQVDAGEVGGVEIEVETEGSAPKRRRLRAAEEREEEDAPQVVARLDTRCDVRKVPSLFNAPGKQTSVFGAVNRRALGLPTSAAQVSMRPILADYVSSNERQIFRCSSEKNYRSFAPPFALAFSNGAKAGGKQVLAVATDEGTVDFINGSEDSEWDAEHSRTTFQAHQNAVFDLAWSQNDQTLATASGDQTIKLWDSETQACVGVLVGHTCTIKNVAFDPFNSNLLSTASRDGSIRVWDRRIPGIDFAPRIMPGCPDTSTGPSIGTVNYIRNAHGAKGKISRGLSATKSVTSVAYLQQSENLLASSGSSDSVIKIWDLRKSYSRRVNPPFLESNAEAVTETGSARPHGISSMVLSPNGQRLYALSTDSRIYAFDPLNLTIPAPIATYQHPRAFCGSFYVRMSVSPCSRYIASGSSEGGVYMWDAEGSGNDGVRLLGHELETSGLDWGKDRIASCSDDHLVRIWSPREDVARKARSDKELRWRWSGEEEV